MRIYPDGPEFRVDVHTLRGELYPSVAGLPDGARPGPVSQQVEPRDFVHFPIGWRRVR